MTRRAARRDKFRRGNLSRERGSVACWGPGKFDVYTVRFLQNCYKFDAKLSSLNFVKFSCGYFGNFAKFAIIARK